MPIVIVCPGETPPHKEFMVNTLIKVISGEHYTPYGLAMKLGATVMLESSSEKKGRDRYSLLLVREAFRLSQEGDQVIFQRGERRHIWNGCEHQDILDVLLYFARQHVDPEQDFPFPAGGIGFLSFEFCRFCDQIRLDLAMPDPLNLPDALFLFGHVFLIYDHHSELIYLAGLNYQEAAIDLPQALNAIEARIIDGDWSALEATAADYTATIAPQGYDPDAVFVHNVALLRQEVIEGNLLQAVPSRRLLVKTAMPALEGYRRLRSANPSPYMFYLDFGQFQVFGSSPELHLKVKGDLAEMRPIAGTRRRGRSQAEDHALEAELLADAKERAEHLMLLDLARNDLGRIATPGSVQAGERFGIERYSHVMHIVSRVQARLKSGLRGIDALRASFPAGTVSGAPKIRAIETIHRLEPVQRRVYSGLVGYLAPDGSLDTCIAIRSIIKKGNIMALQAGAGIVFDSQPERELEETYEKMRATAQSIGLAI